jgi:(2Fe-2S) ferredoxin
MSVKDITKVKHTIFMCNGGCCNKAGAEEMILTLRKEIRDRELFETVHTVRTKCIGRCDDAAVVFIQPECLWYKCVSKEDAKTLVNDYIINNKIVEENFLYKHGDAVINSDAIPNAK